MQWISVRCVHKAKVFAFFCWLALFVCCNEWPAAANASDAAHPPIIAGYQRFFGEAASDPDKAPALGGRLLVGELGCAACHAIEGIAAPAAKQAPILTTAATRIQPDYLRRFIADPATVKPGTTMPSLLHGMDENERQQKVEALVHYLVSLSGSPQHELPIVGARKRGETLFHQVGCAVCHGDRADDATVAHAVPLGNLSEKYSLPGLTQFLLDPLHVRPSGRMPGLNLSHDEASDIAAMLLQLPEVARLHYASYEGNWNKLPDFKRLAPVASGGAETMDVALATRRDRFALRFSGFLHIAEPGEYKLHLGSDDGSRLILDGRRLIDNDGVHPFTLKSATVRLEARKYPVVVEYFEQGGGEELVIEIEGPGLQRQPIAQRMSADETSPQIDASAFQLQPDAALVAQGRRLFADLGCARCHVAEPEQGASASELSLMAVAPAQLEKGCLASSPRQGVPWYGLSGAQRADLAAALRTWPHGGDAFAPQQSLELTMLTLNCYNCHQRGDRGGPLPQQNDLFVTAIPEMGDEGRLPPPLTGVGGKLTEFWLNKILAEGSKDRPYMLTRMPKFGSANAGHLVALLARADELPAAPQPEFDLPPAEVKEIGRKLVGEGGLSCIKCHTFGSFRSQGIQSLDLRTMHRRLRPEWVLPYLRNPQQFRPGTRMPAAWPATGKSFFTEYFAGDSDAQVAAVWAYLSDGERARIPAGLITPDMELVPIEHAIVYRNFIQGAGTRAIGVGYPEAVHQAFDANDLRIALLWQGRFIDASRHWSGRGEGFQPPESDNVLSLPEGPPIARLDRADQAWPEHARHEVGYRFLGYSLTKDQRPTFRYRFADVQAEDFLDTRNLAPGDPLTRRLTFTRKASSENLFFRAAAGRIEPLENGWYRIDDRWQIHIAAQQPTAPIVRESGGRQELLLPLQFENNRCEVTELLQW